MAIKKPIENRGKYEELYGSPKDITYISYKIKKQTISKKA